MTSDLKHGDRWIAAGSIAALLGVAAGAFGAHALRARLAPDNREVFEVAARYQMYHAFALIAVGILARQAAGKPRKWLRAAGWCFVTGIVLFSGSLYALAISDVKILGTITPLGGAAFLLGWTVLGIDFLLSPKAATAE